MGYRIGRYGKSVIFRNGHFGFVGRNQLCQHLKQHGQRMKNFRDSLNEHLKNPELKKEWDALEEEYNLIRQKLDAEEEF